MAQVGDLQTHAFVSLDQQKVRRLQIPMADILFGHGAQASQEIQEQRRSLVQAQIVEALFDDEPLRVPHGELHPDVSPAMLVPCVVVLHEVVAVNVAEPAHDGRLAVDVALAGLENRHGFDGEDVVVVRHRNLGRPDGSVAPCADLVLECHIGDRPFDAVNVPVPATQGPRQQSPGPQSALRHAGPACRHHHAVLGRKHGLDFQRLRAGQRRGRWPRFKGQSIAKGCDADDRQIPRLHGTLLL
mmetsp:Transcript_98612/g.283342  ORF Transcript_98612/g.283342 Transcript_98612/m.283342 type:complete len:243 (+) Transcript_98612:333-1061(+)